LTRLEPSHVSDQVVETDLQNIYSAFFGNHAETTLLLPWQQGEKVSPAGMQLDNFRVCRNCGRTAAVDYSGQCKCCQADSEALVRLSKPHQLKEVSRDNVMRVVDEYARPFCSARPALVVFGVRADSLSAVAVHHLFISRDNDDRDLLAFSDPVQDAAHRAGFFAAGTWQNNV